MRLGILLALGLAACQVAAPVQAPEQVRAVDQMISHTIKLEDPGCTGVRIGNGKVVTAKHCLKARAVGDMYSGFKVEYVSPDHDFIVMSGDAPHPRVRMPDPLIGEDVWVVGFPQSIDDLEQHLTVTRGVVAGPVYEDMERITALAYYGNSGGGAWDAAGDLIGIVVEIRPTDSTYNDMAPVPFPDYTYMVPIKLVRRVL